MDKKYPLFTSPLMQVGSFCFVSPTYQHPFKDEWTVGAIGWMLLEILKKEENDQIVLGIEKKIKDNDFSMKYKKLMHATDSDIDNIIETPDVYYEKELLYPHRILSRYLDDYCIIKDKNIPRLIMIVDRTPTEIYYKHLKLAKKIEKIDRRYSDEMDTRVEYGEVGIIDRDKDNIYYVKYIPTGKIHKAPYKQYYADMINEILKYDEKAKQKIK